MVAHTLPLARLVEQDQTLESKIGLEEDDER